jgi:hypothetical protein
MADPAGGFKMAWHIFMFFAHFFLVAASKMP